ncbi:MAG: response regulator [Anaerolineae bacterium]|nr:response regulator [Anaerolineae bacterium]
MIDQATVLIVDDNPVALEILQDLLQSEGYNLFLARNGPEALAKAAQLLPDLIILDVMMPEMTGFEVCRRLRADPVLAEAPVIMITALDDRDSRIEGLQAGADDFISKPYNHAELLARVRTVVRLNRYRKLHSERTQRLKAEEAERIKDHFISNVSHELRTPLSIITLLSGNLDSAYQRLDDDKRQTMIHTIYEQSHVLTTLIDNILDISRLESGKVSMEQQPLDLGQLAQIEFESQRDLANRKAQTFEILNTETLPIQGNKTQVQQIIRNLLNNAIKYTPQRGTIHCECRAFINDQPIPVEKWPGSEQLKDNHWAALRVNDNGVGISEADLPYIFDRFYRVPQQDEVRGTGLGLAIVKELVQLHNGRIAVRSTLGQGSIFAVYLPLLE